MAERFNRIAEYGKQIDFGKTADDYGRYRAGFPAELYRRLEKLGVGLKGQRLLTSGPALDISAAASRARDAASRGWISRPR
jgi:hypothetical protein